MSVGNWHNQLQQQLEWRPSILCTVTHLPPRYDTIQGAQQPRKGLFYVLWIKFLYYNYVSANSSL